MEGENNGLEGDQSQASAGHQLFVATQYKVGHRPGSLGDFRGLGLQQLIKAASPGHLRLTLTALELGSTGKALSGVWLEA